MPKQTDGASQFLTAFYGELERLGLRARDLPGLAVSGGEKALEELLAHLRSLSPGATWHDVLPDLPPDWIPGRPETWITPYRPEGPWDYQELPTGQAIRVTYQGDASEQSWLDSFIAAARGAGWPVYGGGFPYENKADMARRWKDGTIVLSRGTDVVTFNQFLRWVDEEPSVKLIAVDRTGEERYRE
jgi:hypothetical protein